MPRSRSSHDNIPGALVATYYQQRATAGLIVTEGTSPSPNGVGYPRIPGLYNAEQVRGWRLVTDAVHKSGGRIFVQFMHTGRVSHQDNLPAGARVVGPSEEVCPGQMLTDKAGPQAHTAPHVMSEADIAQTVAEYAAAVADGANMYENGRFENVVSGARWRVCEAGAQHWVHGS